MTQITGTDAVDLMVEQLLRNDTGLAALLPNGVWVDTLPQDQIGAAFLIVMHNDSIDVHIGAEHSSSVAQIDVWVLGPERDSAAVREAYGRAHNLLENLEPTAYHLGDDYAEIAGIERLAETRKPFAMPGGGVLLRRGGTYEVFVE